MAAQPSRLYALLHAAGTAEAHIEAELDTIGLSMAKLVALSAIAGAGGRLPLGQLAERLSCVRSNITQNWSIDWRRMAWSLANLRPATAVRVSRR
ncbi:MAG: hypothetical protein GEU82_15235 [Luteitalea sp.]|nr:hypothetical protein [Luteitalea sp.]